jgi:hypothetical protein
MNPQVAPFIQKYPQDMEGDAISEMHQVPNGRWFEVDPDLLPPSVLNENRRYYIHEVAQLKDGRWVVPQMWIENRHKKLCTDCYLVQRDQEVSQSYPCIIKSHVFTGFTSHSGGENSCFCIRPQCDAYGIGGSARNPLFCRYE